MAASGEQHMGKGSNLRYRLAQAAAGASDGGRRHRIRRWQHIVRRFWLLHTQQHPRD